MSLFAAIKCGHSYIHALTALLSAVKRVALAPILIRGGCHCALADVVAIGAVREDFYILNSAAFFLLTELTEQQRRLGLTIIVDGLVYGALSF